MAPMPALLSRGLPFTAPNTHVQWLWLRSGVPMAVLQRSCRTVSATEHTTIHRVSARLQEVPMTAVSDSSHSTRKIGAISKAMAAYLKAANDRAELMSYEVEKYELGKRHLANMMGVDPNAITQEDVDKAIEYLLPSGLFSIRSRPVMKHPEELFPKFKKAEFGMDGRPFHWMFYTLSPSFYEVMFQCADKVEALRKYEDERISRGHLAPDQSLKIDGTAPMSLEELQNKLVEKIDDSQYKNFLVAMDDLIQHPYSYREQDFILSFRVAMNSTGTVQADSAQPMIFNDSSGRCGVKVTGYRRKQTAEVILLNNGTGKVTIDGKEISELIHQGSREVILTPFTLLNCLGEYDVEATCSGGGESSKAGAVRHGISQALSAFVDEADKEKLRLAGLLSRDYRRHERKKVGQPGARKKWTWKKR